PRYNLVGTSNTMFPLVNSNIRNDAVGLANSLADNGAVAGYPQTLALANTSPGFRTGYQALAGSADPLGKDQRGRGRQAHQVSIGAMDPDAAVPVSPATSLVSDADPSAPGQLVTFTATVTAAGGTPTGTVSFYDGTSMLGTGTLTP